jgi:hypothetical protein
VADRRRVRGHPSALAEPPARRCRVNANGGSATLDQSTARAIAGRRYSATNIDPPNRGCNRPDRAPAGTECNPLRSRGLRVNLTRESLPQVVWQAQKSIEKSVVGRTIPAEAKCSANSVRFRPSLCRTPNQTSTAPA